MIDRTQLAVAVLGAAAGVVVLAILPQQVPGASLAAWSDMRSPAFFPIWAAVVVLVSSGVIALQALRGGLRTDEPPISLCRPAAVAAVLAAFVACAAYVGTVVSMALMAAGLAWLFGLRRPAHVLILAVATALAIHLSFERGLKILFPHGWLY